MAKANLATKITRACDLWPVAYLCYLYFFRVNREVQCYVYPGQAILSGFLKLTPK